ncbi:hypothetical protein SAMN02910418_02132 [Bowdeniella nasicola]|uniref:PqqD family protein, HPr-rel-A system n=1 Tax=Bowdeniella nasicola TaxID=208480 RepID=A0A1H4D491_9ACTO|nr:hypothetical protein [Bowdeniella nasicola]SEA67408.1 hypothetical protein SAMN02910418_02132 [Bowdeniella nasicola]
MDRKYSALPWASEFDGSTLWVAPLPQGPVLQLDGVAPSILQVLSESPEPLNVNELIDSLEGAGLPVPEEAHDQVRAFLESAVTYEIVAVTAAG